MPARSDKDDRVAVSLCVCKNIAVCCVAVVLNMLIASEHFLHMQATGVVLLCFSRSVVFSRDGKVVCTDPQCGPTGGQ